MFTTLWSKFVTLCEMLSWTTLVRVLWIHWCWHSSGDTVPLPYTKKKSYKVISDWAQALISETYMVLATPAGLSVNVTKHCVHNCSLVAALAIIGWTWQYYSNSFIIGIIRISSYSDRCWMTFHLLPRTMSIVNYRSQPWLVLSTLAPREFQTRLVY